MKVFTKSFLALLLMTVMGVVSASAKTEKVHATFEAPSNTNTTWDAETKTFTWSTTYYNQLRNIGLPSGDITKYKKLVVDCTIKSGDQFRILFYKGGANLTLYAKDGVNEFIIKDELEAIAPNDYNEYLLACDEICLSGNNGAAPGEAVINDVYLETYDDEGEKVYATFEAPSNTNTTWDAETKTFTWSTTYYNQLRNIGLPSGDISGYKKLVVDCSIKSGERFRILFYKGGANLTLYAVDGLNEFIIKDELEAVAPNDYNEYLLACDEICLSGNNGAAPGEVVINSVYLETYPENESVEIPEIEYEEDPGKPEGDYIDFTEAFPDLKPRIGLGDDEHPIVLGNGDVVVGQRSQNVIADLSAYSSMTVVATPGLKLVTYMNHEIEAKQNLEEYSEEDAGKYEFIQGQTGEDGLYTLDLTQFSKQDLNCLCLPWDNTNKGTVWYILLTKGEEVEPIYIETDLTNQFKALTVNTNWTWNDGANTAGYTAENFCPKVTTNAGESVQVCEHYEGNCDYSDVFSQTITGLAAGTYKIELYGGAAYTFGRGFSSEAFAEGTWNAGDKIEPSEEVSTGVTLYAESEGETYGGEIPIYYATDFPDGAATVTLEGVVVGESGSIKIGMTKTSKSTNWHVIQLKGVTAQVLATDALESAVALAETIEEGSVPAAIYSDLTSTVDENNKTYKTADEYKTAIAAINDAVNKANAYAAASEYFTKMGDVLEATNVYTQEAYDAVYGSWLADYEAGTLDAEVLSTLTANLAYSTGWHSSNNIDDVLLSAWTVGGEQCKEYDKSLYINTWSTEGNNDGTDFFTPFFEYWTGDDNSLGANALQATVAGLEADGTYDVTVWARVRYKNGAEGEPYGIALSVGEGKAVDVCAGEAVEGTQFYIGEFTAKGKADAEGNLTITFNVAEDNNISWLSFKNVKYVVGEAEPEPEPEPIDPDLIEIAQDQGIGLDDFARAELVEGEEYNTYTAGGFQVAFKMYDVDVKDCDYVIVKFAEPLPAGWHIAFWAKEGQDQVDIPEGATEYKYVFADDEKCAVSEDGILPQICLLTLWNIETPVEAKVIGVYKHKAESGEAVAINGINGTAQKADGKYLEGGKIIILKGGVKYNVAGQVIK